MTLTTTYFGPVSWYKALLCTDETVEIEAHENYVKQTERNRCRIATANGVQMLTVPVTLPERKAGGNIRDVRVSDHGNWRHQHWEALKTAYGMSPFFDFYADDIRPFFERRWEFLFDYNMETTSKILDLIGKNRTLGLTTNYRGDTLPEAKSPATDAVWAKPYYQTFQFRHGFIPNLSILDLLFNEGPASVLYLR